MCTQQPQPSAVVEASKIVRPAGFEFGAWSLSLQIQVEGQGPLFGLGPNQSLSVRMFVWRVEVFG